MHFGITVDKTQTDKKLQIVSEILALFTLYNTLSCFVCVQSNMYVIIGAILVHCVT